MHISQLFIGSTTSERNTMVVKTAHSFTTSQYDIHRISPSEKTMSIGIGSIKSLISTLTLSPIQGTAKVCIVDELQYATTEAQNALLKLIEEPGKDTTILLTSESENGVLPTILSRCQIIKLKSIYDPIDPELEKDIFTLLASTGASKMILAEKYADRHKGSHFLKASIEVLRDSLLQSIHKNQSIDKTKVTQIRMLERARNTMQNTNINSRLLLETVLLEFGD